MASPGSSDLSDLLSPLPADEAETIPATEAADTAAIVADIAASVSDRYLAVERGEKKPSPSGARAVRDAHPKILGCCKATVEVRADLPGELAHGVFVPGARYPAWVRYSNGNGDIRSDRTPDARGMALKLCGLAGSLGPRLPTFTGDEQATQDFVCIDHPVFFVRNARDYVEVARNARNGSSDLRFFFPSILPWRWRIHELLVARRIVAAPDSVLGRRFFSMTPYRLGPHVVKVSMRGVSPVPPLPAGTPEVDVLRRSLSSQLQAGPAKFRLEVQRRRPGMSVEDATLLWDEDEAPFEHVADITLAQQTPDSPERLRFGDRLSFSPWHGLLAHRPLGNLNRIRRVVYATIARERRRFEGDPPTFEPRGDEP